MLVVIDYGAGNLRSVLHALHHLRAPELRLARAPDELRGATRLILPGVGAFGAGMAQLAAQGLVQPIRDAIASGVPYLGICLGMQFLFDGSDEMGQHAGLGVLPGRVTRIPPAPGRKVPHMGWNRLDVCRPSPLLRGVRAGDYAYFVHSYYCVPDDGADVAAVVDYGEPLTAVVARGHAYGVQFHPEKSQRTGLTILRNFLELEA